MSGDERLCRACAGTGLREVLDLGPTPMADYFPTAEELQASPSGLPPATPLELVFCPACSLVQITKSLPPKLLFGRDYLYLSSVSSAYAEHARKNAEELRARVNAGPDTLVVEPASNDGYLLRYFLEYGSRVLGVEPAPEPAAIARERGIETLEIFFDEALAREIRSSHGPADLFLANNVLAHVPDLNGFVAGMAALLADQGWGVIEVPYVVDLVEGLQFDTIYHEHLCYFSVTALEALLRRHGLFIAELRRLPIHGGSLRLYVRRSARTGAEAVALLEREAELGVPGFGYYAAFADRVATLRTRLRGQVHDLQKAGHRIAGYGAAAKAATLLSYCGLGRAELDFIADLNPKKQGRFMTGCHVPIVAPSRLIEDLPAYTLLLTWNFADEILAQQAEYRRRGGRFIVPIPEVRIV